jgi:hypothetical protein
MGNRTKLNTIIEKKRGSFYFSFLKVFHDGMVVAYVGLMSTCMGIHAYDRFA